MKKNTLTVLAIDPGLTNTGWVLLECNPITGKVVITKLGDFHPGPTADKALYREDVEKFRKRTISLKLLREETDKLLLELNPDYIVAEDIFFNPQRPTAHEALAMWHCVVRLSCMYMLNKPLVVVPTKVAKHDITGNGCNSKLSVQQAVMTSDDISFKNKALEMRINEHCADAVAVGYSFFKRNHDELMRETGAVRYSK